MSELPPDPETHDADVAAAELALGVLDGPARAEAERRRLAEPGFARAVDDWSMRLGRIAADEAEPRSPPPGLWAQIAGRLGTGGSVVELKLRRSLQLWRGAAAGAGALAAALAFALVLRPNPAPPPAAQGPVVAAAPQTGFVQAASLTAAKGRSVAFVAVFDPDRGELVLTPASISGLPGKSPELWVIPTGGKPVSLGVAQFGKPVRLKVKDLGGGEVVKTLAVSVEPQGGSPTGQPTGPVIATGQLQAL